MSKIKTIVFLTSIITAVFVTTGCAGDQTQVNNLQQQTKMIQQLKDDYVKLEERTKTLENQVKALNNDVYGNTKRVEALEEVYDYVARDNNLPGTGEELPSNALND